jgi:hypothetical protein
MAAPPPFQYRGQVGHIGVQMDCCLVRRKQLEMAIIFVNHQTFYIEVGPPLFH